MAGEEAGGGGAEALARVSPRAVHDRRLPRGRQRAAGTQGQGRTTRSSFVVPLRLPLHRAHGHVRHPTSLPIVLLQFTAQR